MILVDTTVLIYAVGADHPLRDPCRRVVAAVGDGRLRATTTVEVIQEFVHVRARRRDRADAVALGSSYATLFAPLVTVDSGDLAAGLGLYRDRERLGAFDAVLAAACMRREHIEALFSADSAFGGIDALVHLDPADPRLEARLGI